MRPSRKELEMENLTVENMNTGELINNFGLKSKSGHILQDHCGVSRDDMMKRIVETNKTLNSTTVDDGKFTARQVLFSNTRRCLRANTEIIEAWLSLERPSKQASMEEQDAYERRNVNIKYRERKTGEIVMFDSKDMAFKIYETKGFELSLERRFDTDVYPYGFRIITAYPAYSIGEPIFQQSAEEFFDSHPEYSLAQKTAFAMRHIYGDNDNVRVAYALEGKHKDVQTAYITTTVGSDDDPLVVKARIRDDGKPKFEIRDGKGECHDITDSEDLKKLFDKKNLAFPHQYKNDEILEEIKSFKREINCRLRNIEDIRQNKNFASMNARPKNAEIREAENSIIPKEGTGPNGSGQKQGKNQKKEENKNPKIS